MNAPTVNFTKDKGFEARYQIAMATFFASASAEPVLVKPRQKYRGWCWNNYRIGGKGNDKEEKRR